ncbi:MAG: nucleotidyltransferase domain-containing protein [Actinomycetota bacterium]|nr:nucleotidyltransferase domain-containing protein [Actinomycetota bacterium]MDK1017422.1 nucleotidyltransferase domain-containing protein [Actinomycetota bacterium]MDK1019609.1 nucleotidyltransferase domain-containing protein [Actinomycetota bacterium]MDK1025910.1 nucleotidyltransferase domain-containing protein [Actinomycetota bacterium]MDK1038667.1 nucleotidyltransferase domain-containing protein [Actinomycetota bacterium]
MTNARRIGEAPSLELLEKLRSEIFSVATRNGGSNIRVYGSVVHGAVGPQSDIDLLVDMDHGRSLLDLAALHLELEDLLEFPAELGTDVKPRLRERVHAEAIAL